VKTKDYKVLARAVEDGVAHGVRRFYKHRDDEPPDLDALSDVVAEAVVEMIGEWFDFEAPGV
jgi:hypothetical protein